MSDIRIAIEHLNEPQKSLGKALMEFYETMKSLEKDEHRGGKQATKIVMTINDIEMLFSSPDNTARTAEEGKICGQTCNCKDNSECAFTKQDSKEVTCKCSEGQEYQCSYCNDKLTNKTK